jgi:hypothetical protein
MTARPQALVKSEGDEIKDDAEEKQLRLKIERWVWPVTCSRIFLDARQQSPCLLSGDSKTPL